MPVVIPIVPLPAFNASGGNPVFGPDLRASNADRDVAADILCAAVADGRLTLAELDERLENVLSARTLRELARLISDLHGPGSPGSVRTDQRPAHPRPQVPARWALLQSLLTPRCGPSEVPAVRASAVLIVRPQPAWPASGW
jgi:hypothetical protein